MDLCKTQSRGHAEQGVILFYLIQQSTLSF